MTLKAKIQLAWKNRGQIMEGFYNAYVNSTPEVKEEALKRLDLCRSNKCGLHNPKGENDENMKAVFPGKESCGGCGCDLYAKCHAMSAHCFLVDVQVQAFKNLWLEGKMINSGLSPEQIELIQTAPVDQLWELIKEVKQQVPTLNLGTEPLWEAVMSVEQEMEINKIAYQKQFENRK